MRISDFRTNKSHRAGMFVGTAGVVCFIVSLSGAPVPTQQHKATHHPGTTISLTTGAISDV